MLFTASELSRTVENCSELLQTVASQLSRTVVNYRELLRSVANSNCCKLSRTFMKSRLNCQKLSRSVENCRKLLQANCREKSLTVANCQTVGNCQELLLSLGEWIFFSILNASKFRRSFLEKFYDIFKDYDCSKFLSKLFKNGSFLWVLH